MPNDRRLLLPSHRGESPAIEGLGQPGWRGCQMIDEAHSFLVIEESGWPNRSVDVKRLRRGHVYWVALMGVLTLVAGLLVLLILGVVA